MIYFVLKIGYRVVLNMELKKNKVLIVYLSGCRLVIEHSQEAAIFINSLLLTVVIL